MEKYSIILPNEKAKTYEYVTLFILLTNLFVFAFISYNSQDFHIRRLTFWGTIITLFSLALIFLNLFTKNRYPSKIHFPFRIEIVFFILAIIWFLAEKYLLGLCIICFAVIGMYTRQKFEVIFSKDGIIYPSFPKKTFLWSDISNAILKDGMLTIDLKNNKLIQTVIDKESALAINESEFNLFCKSQLDN
ncbi:MAG: hypothetical protein ABI402_21475 [Ferruginibacter sp.]